MYLCIYINLMTMTNVCNKNRLNVMTEYEIIQIYAKNDSSNGKCMVLCSMQFK